MPLCVRFDEVSETLLSYNNDVETDKHDCGVNVQAEFAAVWGMLETPDQWDELQTRFGLCEPIINAAEFYQLVRHVCRRLLAFV